MIFEYIHPDNTREVVALTKQHEVSENWKIVDGINKKEFIKNFYSYYQANQKIILFDKNHQQLLEFYNKNNIDDFNGIEEVNKIAKMLFFTSGSTGFPLGAFKSSINLLEEVETLAKLLVKDQIKRVVVTVPFVHIYGVIVGLLLPLYLNNITLVIKEEFLPYDLLKESDRGETLFITTPIFIKALLQVKDFNTMNNCIFISSTAPLAEDEVNDFEKKFTTKLLQLFGSTETGGVAYKWGVSTLWQKLDSVEISSINDNLNVSSPYLSKFIIQKKIEKIQDIFQTEDIIELHGEKFKLLGRSNKIIKIAGKRISSMQLESIIEKIDGIKNVLVTIIYNKNSFKNEQIMITLESTRKITNQEVKAVFKKKFGLLSIPLKITYVDKISYSSVGKKIFF